MQFLAALLACPAFIALTSTAVAFQVTTTRVSVDSAGVQANGHNFLSLGSISGDGRFCTFMSVASNLVAGDTNATWDVFVHDRTSGTTERVSVATSGAQGNSDSRDPSISTDGRFVAFDSFASNLVAGDTNATSDVFVRDRTNGTTERVSLATAGTQGNSISYALAISADGSFVAFLSSASNLVAGDTNAANDIFVRDRMGGTTERVSVATGGAQANGGSGYCSISGDGRFVAFDSLASNLVAGDSNGTSDVFVRDRTGATTERVSVDSAGAQGSASSSNPSVSADGRFVAFTSLASNLVAGDTNATTDVFVRDRTSATTERVSVDSTGAQASSHSSRPSIAADGRCIAFESAASNLVAGDTNGVVDVFVHDRPSGTTERVSVTTGGTEGNQDSDYPSISADGRCVMFRGKASDLVVGDTNGVNDLFVRDRGRVPPSYCTAGTTTNGCIASIYASASPSLSLANPCTISVTSVEVQKSGILFFGVDNTGFTSVSWAAGSTSWLCVKPPTQRTPIQNSGGTINVCDGSFVLDWNAYQTANPLSLGNPWSVGDKVYLQAWFRDPLAVKSTNLSNALELTYVP